MEEQNVRAINTPKNEFLPKEAELFNLYLKMPVLFKEDWKRFRTRCKEEGFQFEDVLGDLIIRYGNGELEYKEPQTGGIQTSDAPKKQ